MMYRVSTTLSFILIATSAFVPACDPQPLESEDEIDTIDFRTTEPGSFCAEYADQNVFLNLPKYGTTVFPTSAMTSSGGEIAHGTYPHPFRDLPLQAYQWTVRCTDAANDAVAFENVAFPGWAITARGNGLQVRGTRIEGGFNDNQIFRAGEHADDTWLFQSSRTDNGFLFGLGICALSGAVVTNAGAIPGSPDAGVFSVVPVAAQGSAS